MDREDLLLVPTLEMKVQGGADPQQVRRDTQRCGQERGMLLGAREGQQHPVLVGLLRPRPLLPADSCQQDCNRGIGALKQKL